MVLLTLDLGAPSSDLERINVFFLVLISLAVFSFPLVFGPFPEDSLNVAHLI